MSVPDSGQERPRPQFGEYASPEEQQAHIRTPLPPQQDASFVPATHHVLPPLPGGGAGEPKRRPVDRVFSIILIVLGALSVLVMAPGLFSFTDSLTQTLGSLGVPADLADQPRDQAPYTIGAVVLIVGFLLTAAATLALLRAGKVSSWVPVVGAIVTWMILSMVISPALMADPGFMYYVNEMGGSTGVPTP